MQVLRGIGVFLIVLLIASPCASEIEVIHDRFDGTTSVRSKITPVLGGPLIFVMGVISERVKEPYVNLMLAYRADTWRYLNCHTTYWLADGARVDLPQPTHQGTVGNGYVFEQLTILNIGLQSLQKLAQAQRVEYKICNDEYVASAEEVQDFRIALAYLQKLKRGESLSDPGSSRVPSSATTEAQLDAEYENARRQTPFKRIRSSYTATT